LWRPIRLRLLRTQRRGEQQRDRQNGNAGGKARRREA
jgi:hypothetical protein